MREREVDKKTVSLWWVFLCLFQLHVQKVSTCVRLWPIYNSSSNLFLRKPLKNIWLANLASHLCRYRSHLGNPSVLEDFMNPLYEPCQSQRHLYACWPSVAAQSLVSRLINIFDNFTSLLNISWPRPSESSFIILSMRGCMKKTDVHVKLFSPQTADGVTAASGSVF